MSFYSDTENIIPVNQISDLIKQLLPSFMTEEGEEFSEFLKKYYEWMESHELIIENAVQNEFKLQLHDERSPGLIKLEDDNYLNLESTRGANSGFIKGERITGQSSGATGFSDRNSLLSDNILFPSNVTGIDFEPGETIIGATSRVSATVHNYYKNPLFASRTLLKNRDIDTATSFFIKQFEKEFLSELPDTLSGSKPLIMKHIVDVYRAKGSKASYDWR